MDEEQIQHQDYAASHSNPVCAANSETSNMNGFPVMPVYSMGVVGSGLISVQSGNPMEKLTLGQGIIVDQNGPPKQLVRAITVVPDHPKTSTTASNIITTSSLSSSSVVDPPTLSLGLSLSSDQRQTSSRHSPINAMPCFNNGDNIISVA